MSQLTELLDGVTDEVSFLAFVKALEQDRRTAARLEAANPSNPYASDAGGWECTTIEDYLESARAWAVDSDFGRKLAPDHALHDVSPWKRFATFLYCGKIYE